MIGRKISNFHINERIGEGGMGTVYKATDLSLKRTVAIKMLHPFLVNNPDSFKRFRNEAHLSARISHPNVATLYDFQKSGKTHFIIMEFVKGKSLEEVLKLQERLPQQEAVIITLQALEGLGAAHELGIMHRDLKPGNIMVTSRGFVKLMDFGIARHEDTERMTRQDSIIGTLDYLSPELVKGAAPSKASDLYAAGVMLYEMLSGQTLFSEDSKAALMYQIAHKQPNFQLEGLDRRLVRVIKKLTHKQVSKRYQSTHEVIKDLEQIHRSGKVNILLLEKKLKPEKKQSVSAIALPFNLSIPQLPNFKQINFPLDVDLRILAGALVLCLIILVIGLSGSSSPYDQSEGPTNGSNLGLLNLGEDSLTPNNNYPLSPLQTSNQKSGEIQFIERFEDTGEASIKDEENSQGSETENSQTKKPKKKNTSTNTKKKGKLTDGNNRKNKAPVKKEKQTVTTQEKSQVADAPKEKFEKTKQEEPIEKKVYSSQENERKAIESVKIRIPDMYLSASFAENVSSERNLEGQIIYLSATSHVYHGGHLVIQKGANVKAMIKKLRKSTNRKKAFLAITLQSVQAVNGNWLAISYPEYSNLSKTVVEFKKGQQLTKIKLKSTNLTLKN